MAITHRGRLTLQDPAPRDGKAGSSRHGMVRRGRLLPLAAASGRDSSWRTVIEATGADSFRMLMYNVSPQGKEDLAVEAAYTRTK